MGALKRDRSSFGVSPHPTSRSRRSGAGCGFHPGLSPNGSLRGADRAGDGCRLIPRAAVLVTELPTGDEWL
jgi:hypothetical protein